MTFRYWLSLAALWLALAGPAQAGDALTSWREASQLVAGTIEVDEGGAVSGYRLDDADLLPPPVRAHLAQAIPHWRFEPVRVDGQPTRARTDMSVRLVLKTAGEGQLALSIGGVSFGNKSGGPAAPVPADLTPPPYPVEGLMSGATATVYLVVKVGRDGAVEDAIDEQVNFTNGSDVRGTMAMRKAFVRSALRQARQWRFKPPTAGREVDAPYWSVRVPVIFTMAEKPPAPGSWELYQPGRRKPVPWAMPEQNAAFSPDAQPPGGAYAAGETLHMLSMGGAP